MKTHSEIILETQIEAILAKLPYADAPLREALQTELARLDGALAAEKSFAERMWR